MNTFAPLHRTARGVRHATPLVVAEMRNGLRCYMGAKDGAAYAGVVKSAAQIDQEFFLIERDEQGLPVEGDEVQCCARRGCDKAGTTRCAPCRSVW